MRFFEGIRAKLDEVNDSFKLSAISCFVGMFAYSAGLDAARFASKVICCKDHYYALAAIHYGVSAAILAAWAYWLVRFINKLNSNA